MAHSNLVQSVIRAADILVELGGATRALALRELSERLGLKPPTLHNLLRTLKARGFVRQLSGHSGYVLGPAILDLARRRGESCLMTVAERELKKLFVEYGRQVTVTFSELIGGELQTSLRMSPELPGLVQRPQRPSLNPYTSASALVLHAFVSAEDKQTICERHPFLEEAGRFAADPDGYHALLIETRRRGYALRPCSVSGHLALAAPVLDSTGDLLGIIGISRLFPEGIKVGRMDEKKMAASLLAAAKRISARNEDIKRKKKEME